MIEKTSANLLRELKARISDHLDKLYPDENLDTLTASIVQIMGFEDKIADVKPHSNLWDEKDIVTITYGDSIKKNGELPLEILHQFLTEHLQSISTIIHILPFYPYSSDDGFSVINYCEVNQSLGNWENINCIANDFALMADLVINHCSSRSLWFENYKQGKDPGTGFFIESDPAIDLSNVVRPRTTPLLRKTQTLDAVRYVWCTFSHDQIDLNFKNPHVLLEFVRIIKLYLDQGIRVFRLDAVAFLWKEIGTPCINLPNTHELIRLLRLLIEHTNSLAIVITETNIPNRENLSYFGNANEAHLIYNFTLPPLILYTMLAGESHLLRQWMMSMPPAQNGTSYFNFIASHDGIGLRPVEGILSDEKVDEIASLIQRFGGDVSWRTLPNGETRPYELNISLIDAMKGTFRGEDNHQLARFICAHAIILALEGIPAFYIHSLLATENDQEKLNRTSNKRAINRHNWDYDELVSKLKDTNSLHYNAYTALTQLITIRKQQKAFHPNATQFTMHFDEAIFAFWRQSQDRSQSIFCIYNVTNTSRDLALKDVNLIELDQWRDLISGYKYQDPRENVILKPYEFLWVTNK